MSAMQTFSPSKKKTTQDYEEEGLRQCLKSSILPNIYYYKINLKF